MKLPSVPSEGLLKALPASERKKLGRAGMTRAQAQARFDSGKEKELQALIYQDLTRRNIYFEYDPMHRKTSGKRGRSDFRICVQGLWLSLECKTETGTLSKEQAAEAARLRASGGTFKVVFSFADYLEALRDMSAL